MGKEPITIKKTKLTLKAPVAPEPTEAPEAASNAAAPSEAAPKKEAKSGKGDMIFQAVSLAFAVLATVLFAALLFIQVSENSFYNDAMPPPFVPGSIPVSAPAPATELAPIPTIEAPATSPAPAEAAPAATPAPAAAADAAAPAAAGAPAAAPAADTPPAAPAATP